MKRVLIILLPLLVLLAPASMQGQGASRAGVVVRFGDGSVHSSCVRFAEPSISGLELLQRSGLDVIAQSFGNSAAVCKIGPDGCNFPAESCLACKFGSGQRGEYWAYWQLDNGAWRYSQIGASARRVRDGDVDGWAYGPGNVQAGVQPPITTFDQICPAEPPPRPTAAPALTTAPAPTPRPAPPTPQPTNRPTSRPPASPTAPPTQAPAAATTRTAEPTAAPSPPTETPVQATTAAPATSTPAPTPTSAPTATAAPTRVMASPAAITTTPIAAGATAEAEAGSTRVRYAIWGALLGAIGGAIALAVRRRR